MNKKPKTKSPKRKPIKRSLKRTAPDGSHNITFTVVFKKGAGGIYFHGENIPENLLISSDSPQKNFTVSQSAGHHIVTVSGSAPSGGSITVEVSENGTVLSKASDNEFKNPTFSGFITYDV